MDDFYRVPLSTGEAAATLAVLRLVRDLLRREGTAPDVAPDVLESAAARIEAEIPDFLVNASDKLRLLLAETLARANFGGGASDESVGEFSPMTEVAHTRRLLEKAWRSSGVAEIEYYVASRNEWSTRRVEISNIYERGNGWYLEGECSLRRDHRMFRLENIRAARMIEGGADEELPDPFDDEGNA